MSDSTKIVLAVVFGALGLAIGIFATVVAVNARNAVNSGDQLTTQVRAEFAASQAAQDAKEQAGLSKAEKFVNSLSRQEIRAVRTLRRTDRRLRAVATQVAAIEADQADEFNRVNRRVSQTNQRVSRLQRQIANLRQEIEILAAAG